MQTQTLIHAESIEPRWQQLLANAITDPQQLIERLQLPSSMLEPLRTGAQQFPLRVPEPFLELIEPGNPNDPLLLQVLPQAQEQLRPSGYHTDPLQEASSNPQQGIIHKYQGRLLLMISGGCALNCRYCFRRHFPYQDNPLGSEQWQQALNYLEQHPDIDEVIFSGGDPLATSDSRLERMLSDLEQLPQLKRLRIHTRLPIAIPQRLSERLTQLLTNSRLQVVMVLHSNHPQEIGQQLEQHLQPLRQAGVTLLNQSVLLKGINDCPRTLASLSERLFDCGVLPYYLHLLDPVAGAAHFDLPVERAQQLVGELATLLPGYLVPKLSREQPGAPAKVQLAPILPG